MSSNYTDIPGFGQGYGRTPVADIFDLPANGNNIGDTRLVLDTYLSYFWNGTAWTLIPNQSPGPINQNTDSIAIGDGTSLYTSTTTGGAVALDVFQVNVPETSIKPLSTFQTSQYSVGTTRIQLTPIPLSNRSGVSVRVTCTSGNAVYIGEDNTVTTATGYPLFNGDTLQMDLDTSHTIYAISDAPGQTAYVLEIA